MKLVGTRGGGPDPDRRPALPALVSPAHGTAFDIAGRGVARPGGRGRRHPGRRRRRHGGAPVTAPPAEAGLAVRADGYLLGARTRAPAAAGGPVHRLDGSAGPPWPRRDWSQPPSRTRRPRLGSPSLRAGNWALVCTCILRGALPSWPAGAGAGPQRPRCGPWAAPASGRRADVLLRPAAASQVWARATGDARAGPEARGRAGRADRRPDDCTGGRRRRDLVAARAAAGLGAPPPARTRWAEVRRVGA